MARGQTPHRSNTDGKGERRTPVKDPALPPLPTRPPVTSADYVRPAPKDVPGIIRAHREGDDDAAAAAVLPPAEPLFSNEGIFKKRAKVDRRRRRVPLLGLTAGVAGLAIVAVLAGRAGTAPPPDSTIVSSHSEMIMGTSVEPSSTIGSGAIADESPSASASPSQSSGPTASPSPSPEPPTAKPTSTPLPPLKATVKCTPGSGTPPLTVNCTWTAFTSSATPTWYLNGVAYGGHKGTQRFDLTVDSSIQLKVVRSGRTVWSSWVFYP